MKILITGGAGFIGSHLADLLLSKNYQAVAIDNLSLGRIENIKHLRGNKRFKFIKEDLLNFSKLERIFKNILYLNLLDVI